MFEINVPRKSDCAIAQKVTTIDILESSGSSNLHRVKEKGNKIALQHDSLFLLLLLFHAYIRTQYLSSRPSIQAHWGGGENTSSQPASHLDVNALYPWMCTHFPSRSRDFKI